MKNLFSMIGVFTLLIGCSTYGPIHATNNSLKDNKRGSACVSWILAPILPFSWGRNDIMAAAETANIGSIAVVDSSTHWYVVYGEFCTHVYGK